MAGAPNTQSSFAPSPDASARVAGRLLLLAAAATAVMVLTRISADADQPTLLESLSAIADNRPMYAASGVARFASGVALITGAWALSRTWIIRRRFGTPVVPGLFAASGLLTGMSGTAAVLLAMSPAPEITLVNGEPTAAIPTVIEALSDVRWLTGKIGFAIAGAALITASLYQWRARGSLRKIAPASGTIGVLMQFIWIDAATIMHPIVGTAFFFWLVTVGAMLATGRVEQHFIARHGWLPPRRNVLVQKHMASHRQGEGSGPDDARKACQRGGPGGCLEGRPYAEVEEMD